MKNGKIPDLDDGIENLWMCHDLTQCRIYFAIRSLLELRKTLKLLIKMKKKLFLNGLIISLLAVICHRYGSHY